MPLRMVGRDMPVSSNIAFSPPRPRASASRATYQRACDSLNAPMTFNIRSSGACWITSLMINDGDYKVNVIVWRSLSLADVGGFVVSDQLEPGTEQGVGCVGGDLRPIGGVSCRGTHGSGGT